MICLLKWCKGGECMSSRLVGRPRKSWINSVNDCLKKIGLNLGQARRMVYDRNVWWEFLRENACGVARRMNPLL